MKEKKEKYLDRENREESVDVRARRDSETLSLPTIIFRNATPYIYSLEQKMLRLKKE